MENVKVIQSAISNTNEQLSTNENINHCSFVYGNPKLNGKNKVQAVSLDYLLETNTIENIGYIHLDVEGMEYKVLEGAVKILDLYKPIVSFEQHLEIDNYGKIASFFKDRNYSVFLVNEVLPGCRLDCRNSFAFPNEICSESLITGIHDFIGKPLLVRK